jgi:hypothetical protein
VLSSRIYLFAAVALIGTACAKPGEDAVAVHAVSGQVLFEGNRPPPEGAFVVFKPVKEMPLLEKMGGNPRGTVAKDGRFKLTTRRPEDGAPAGDYEVIITWHKPEAGSSEDGPDLLKGRYRDPGQSRLPKITIKEGNNELPPIRLKAR